MASIHTEPLEVLLFQFVLKAPSLVPYMAQGEGSDEGKTSPNVKLKEFYLSLTLSLKERELF
jgi:hypothetical protein